MGCLVVLGEAVRIQGFALAGAVLSPADTPDAVRRAWQELPADAGVVILTQQAAEALLAELTAGEPSRLTVVMPP